MKTTDVTMQAELAQQTTTLARLWTITPVGGAPLYFTDHDRDLTRNGNLYRASKSFMASAIANTVAGATSNVEVTVLLSDDDDAISYLDLQRGKFDGAFVVLELVSFKNALAVPLRLYAGNIGPVSLPTNKVGIITLTGLLIKSNKYLTESYSANCRADFGDWRCTVDLAPYSEPFTVTAVAHKQAFTADIAPADGLYALGNIIWSTGNNAGKAIEVATNDGGNVKLFFGMGRQIEVGDTGTIYRGCPKTVAACIAYGNLPNYRGEPYVPGDDNLGA